MEAKEAIEIIKKNWPDSSFTMLREALETLIPELAESEEEKIKKLLIEAVIQVLQDQYCSNRGVSKEKVLAWLEKQSEQKPTDTCDSLIIKSKEFPASEKRDFGYFNEPTDNVEPKFKVEEEKWYVCTQTYVLRGKIVVIKGQTYQAEKDNVIKGEDGCLFIDRHDGKASEYFRYWTIQDAKDGDVLAAEDKDKVFIYNGKLDLRGRVCAYCGIYKTHDGLRFTECAVGNYFTYKEPYPATKEQCDQLEKAMTNVGYTFDFEKKELKKAEQNPDDKVEPKFKVGNWV